MGRGTVTECMIMAGITRTGRSTFIYGELENRKATLSLHCLSSAFGSLCPPTRLPIIFINVFCSPALLSLWHSLKREREHLWKYYMNNTSCTPYFMYLSFFYFRSSFKQKNIIYHFLRKIYVFERICSKLRFIRDYQWMKL